MATGFKTGGRKAGSVNKTTIARAAAMQAEAKAQGHKLGIDVMREVMTFYLGLGASYQTKYKRNPDGTFALDEKTKERIVEKQGDEKKAFMFLKLAADIAKDLAQYETPKLQPTTLRNDAPEEPIEVKLTIVRTNKPKMIEADYSVVS